MSRRSRGDRGVEIQSLYIRIAYRFFVSDALGVLEIGTFNIHLGNGRFEVEKAGAVGGVESQGSPGRSLSDLFTLLRCGVEMLLV